MAEGVRNGLKQRAVIDLLTTEAVGDKEISDTWITVYRDHVHSFFTIYQWVVHFRNSNSEITAKRRCVRRSGLQHRMTLTLFPKTFCFKRRNNKRNLVSKDTVNSWLVQVSRTNQSDRYYSSSRYSTAAHCSAHAHAS
jgi:hypothetical protein